MPHSTSAPRLGDLERVVMERLWDAGPTDGATVREVHEALEKDREIAYTTVMTVLDRLAKKAGEWKIVECRITYNHRSRLAAENPFDAPKPFPKGTVSESSRDWIGRDAQM